MKTLSVSRAWASARLWFLVLSITAFAAVAKTPAPPPAAAAATFCGTMDAWARRNPAQFQAFRFGLDGACPLKGPCDGPGTRDASIPTDLTPFKLVRLRFHVFADDDGSFQVATLEDITNQVARLNADYFGARFHFIHTAHIVNNSTYRLIETNHLEKVDQMKAAYAEDPSHQINCYVIDYGPGNCGVATFPWDSDVLGATGGMLLDRLNYINPNFAGCISHEMGHMFGLLHTFTGVTEVGDGVCNNCRELAGRSAADGDISGDFCSDTQPEPGITDTKPPCPAPTTYDGLDSCNGLLFTGVNTSNFMSYYVACYNNWTPQQLGRLHCWGSSSLTAMWLVADSTPPVLALTSPINDTESDTFGPINGWVTDNWVVQGVTFALHEIDPSGGVGRWWNGSGWQNTAFPLAATVTGTNWAKADGVALPPLNSGIHYEVSATATDGQFNTSTVSVNVHAPIHDLTWDPGATHLGTEVLPNPNANGGPYYFKITTQSTSNGVWRTALTVAAGDADVYSSAGWLPTRYSYMFGSERVGSDGFCIGEGRQFNAAQDWFILIQATENAQWNLVTGEAFVQEMGLVASYGSSASSTNVPMGAEGWRFFRATPPVSTLAWNLWLRGATNDIFVKKTGAPLTVSYDLRQAREMLVVPSYLVGGDQYLVGVPGSPGEAVQFDSRQQRIIDVDFSSTNAFAISNKFGYVTYRVQVPVQQIAWFTKVVSSLGNADLCVRRDYVPNEWNNDAFSEAPGVVADSLTLVPPTLSDGTFFVTVYGLGNYEAIFTTGNPEITDTAFVSINVNADANRVGWRYYRVLDIASQLGALGWDLFLQNQPPGTELAIRRNAVPGRWRYRQNNNQYASSQGWVDYSGMEGFLQRPGHQADVWYVGVYNPDEALSTFTLNLRPLTGTPIAFDGAGGVNNVVAQPPGKVNYFRVDVPADALGWDLRLTNITSGLPRLVVRREQLPDSLSTWQWYSPWDYSTWPSGYEWAPDGDWTGRLNNAFGGEDRGHILAAGMGDPLEPGTYYVGVMNVGNDIPMSYTLVSRGIGAPYAIPVTPLAFTNGVASIANLPPREAAYFSITVPTNAPNWKVRLSADAGESMMVLQRSTLPNASTWSEPAFDVRGGRRAQKDGNEHFLLLPRSLQTNVPPGTYYAAVVSEGHGPAGYNIGAGSINATLTSFGVTNPINLGTLGADLTQSNSLEGGETVLYQFTVPPNILALEVSLEDRSGNPVMSLRPDALAATPSGNSYGTDGGSSATWQNASLINLANPDAGLYTLTVQAGYDYNFSGYPDAAYTLRVHALTPAPLAFDGGSIDVAGGHRGNTWRYYSVTVPPDCLGWDVRLTNVTSGDPQLVVGRADAPSDLNTRGPQWWWSWSPSYDLAWPTGYQWAATYDWTSRFYDADGTKSYGRILAMGMGNPLEPGDYVIGVINSDQSNPAELRYTLASRGIGPGFSIPVTPLNFASGLALFTNLPPREASYYSVTVPEGASNWQLRLGANVGEAMLAVQQGVLPSVLPNGSNPHYLQGGRRVQKPGHEQYLYLPADGTNALPAGTYYLAVVPEGESPADSGHAGTATSAGTLLSIGQTPTVNLGLLTAGADLQQVGTLEGGACKAYEFTLGPGTLSFEVHLEDRTGNPFMTLRPGTQLPRGWDSYGCDGGQTADYYGANVILVSNPTNGAYSLLVQADFYYPPNGDPPSYADATYTVRVHAVGATPLAFDGGVISITNQPSGTWQYFLVTNVPADALGWDLRLTNTTSGDPRLVVTRELLPDSLSSHGASLWSAWFYPETSTSWPAGYQWAANGFWGDYYSWPGGASTTGHLLQMGMNNPLTSGGNYYIGVLNGSSYGEGANPMTYTIVSRGIGSGFAIPVTTLAYSGGTDTVTNLPVSEAAYYRVTVPSNAPSWKVRLSAEAGDSVLLVQKDALPGCQPLNYAADTLSQGHTMHKVGNEHYVLLPHYGSTTIVAGDYYLLVASAGLFPQNSTFGSNSSSFTITSEGPLPVVAMGTAGAVDLVSSNIVEGGECRAYQFTIPPGEQGIEVRLNNRQGNPEMTLLTGSGLPFPSAYSYYGSDYGQPYGWSSGTVITLANPIATNYTLIVQGGLAYPDWPDASYALRVGRIPVTALAFDPTTEACSQEQGQGRLCTNSAYCRLLADNERAFFRVEVPAVLPDGTPVIGWDLRLSTTFGQAYMRVRQDALPSDDGGLSIPFTQDSATIVPPFLTPGVWYVEVKAQGSTSFCISSRAVRLQHPMWAMPGVGQPIATPGLGAGPYFGDSGVDTNGVPLPGDQGIDLEQGYFHFYAINVPTNNGALLRVMLEAISGNPNLYLRTGGVPTTVHGSGGGGGTLYERSLDGTGTEYGNWVPLNGRYESQLVPGPCYLAIRATGGANCRYRLRLSTGSVLDLSLNHGGYTNQLLIANDWRYYRVVIPSNAPTEWAVGFQQLVGDVVLYLRDTVPPGQGASTRDIRDWNTDRKNHGVPPSSYPSYPSYDAPGLYTNTVPPLRPGHTYYLGFHALNDATFTVFTSTNAATIQLDADIAFYGGSVTNYLPPGAHMIYRIIVPPDATRWISRSIHSSEVRWFLDQGSLPTETWFDHVYSGYNSDISLNQYLAYPNNWPWLPNTLFYLAVTNTSASSQPFFWAMDGKNCATDDDDHDGLPDCWEMAWFGNTWSNWGGNDPDHDGVDNATELLDGTDPTDPHSMYARLTLLTNGPGAVTTAPLQAKYFWGTPVLLTAVPALNYAFHGWTGVPGDTNANPLTLVMTTNRTVTASFVLVPVPLIFTNLAINPSGHFSFTLLGPPAASLGLQAADALGAWRPIRTNTPFTGVFNFEDLGTGSHTNLFYRAYLNFP